MTRVIEGLCGCRGETTQKLKVQMAQSPVPNSEGESARGTPGASALVQSGLLRWTFFVVVASYLTQPIYEAQVLFHETIGRWIWFRHVLPTTDLWTQSTLGMKWTTSSWAFDVLVYLVNRYLGVDGIAFLRFALIFVFLTGLFWTFKRLSRDTFVSAALAIVIACGSLVTATFDSQLLGITAFAVLVGAVHVLRDRRVSIAGVLFAAIVYVNSDSAHVFAIIVSLACLASSRESENRGVCAIALLFAFCCAPTLGLNIPNILHAAWNVLRFDEATGLRIGGLYDYGTSVMLLLSFFLVVFSRKQQFSSASLSLAGLLVLLALLDKTIAVYASCFLGIQIAKLWGERPGQQVLSSVGRLGEGIIRLQSGLIRVVSISPVGVLWVMLCLIAVNIVGLKRIPIYHSAFPVRELQYIQDAQLPSPVFHEASIGPYVVWKFSDPWADPELLAASDSRLKQLKPEQAIAEFQALEQMKNWEGYLDSMHPQTVLLRLGDPLYELLQKNSSWKLVYENGWKVGEPNPDTETRATLLSWAIFVRSSSL